MRAKSMTNKQPAFSSYFGSNKMSTDPAYIDFSFFDQLILQFNNVQKNNPNLNLGTAPTNLGSVSSKIVTETGLSSSIQSGAVTKDNTLGLSGSVVAGATVSVYDGNKFLGYASINGATWSFTTPALNDGSHNLKVVIASGKKSQSFDVSAVIDTVASGTFSSTILTNTGEAKSIGNGGNTKDHTLGFSGTAEVGSIVKIYDGSTFIGQTKADAKGKWSFTTPNLSDGRHDFSAHFVDRAGNEKDVAGISANLTSATTPPTTEQPSHTWSATSGWGSIDALAAINAKTGKNLVDVKAKAGTQWGFDEANINDAWSYGYTGKGITIAEIDTGIDLKNADITKNLHAASWNFIDNSSNVMDDNGHGTFVASEMIAANNGIGLTGASYDASLMVLKALDANGSGSADNICAAIRYAVDNGANIINMSLGGGDYTGYASALQYAKDHNVLVVMAAGNNGSTTPLDPAAYAKQFDNCLAVGALQCNSATGAISMASFSNQAGSTTPYGFVDAAGQGVIGYTVGGGTASWAGTSMAAPLAAATAALVWSSDSAATASQIAQMIYQTSHNVI
jgi:hypothetical protein